MKGSDYMTEKKAVDRPSNDGLTDNRMLVKFRQCIDCLHRADRGGLFDYLGFQKQICEMFDGKDGLYKPLEFNLNEDNEDYMKCLCYVKDPDEED